MAGYKEIRELALPPGWESFMMCIEAQANQR
jgi:hypothetical protein